MPGPPFSWQAHHPTVKCEATCTAKSGGIWYFPTWDALSQENERIWAQDYLPRGAYEPWESWQAWLDAYREIVRDVQDIAEEHDGRRSKERRS